MRLDRIVAALAVIVTAALVGCTSDKPGSEDDFYGSDTGKVQLQIVKGTPGPDYPDARLTVLAPAKDAVVTADSVLVKVDLKGVDLEAPTAGEQSQGIAFSKDGQHIHVIIDDKPYMAMYKTDSFSVGKLAEGPHTLRAFPSRSWHESIKTPGAFVAYTFYVKKQTGTPAIAEGAPLLTYSRPKGEYKGKDAKKILLDFHLSNATLGPDKYKVIATVDGTLTDTLTEWVPYFIEGLSDGEHTVKLELIGPDGKPVPGTYNTAERKITVASKDAPAAPAMMHDSGMKHDSGTTMHGSGMPASAKGSPIPPMKK